MRYLSTDNINRLWESTVFLIIVCLLGLCHGVLLMDNSPLYLSLACSLLLTVIIYGMERNSEPQAQAWVLAPFIIAAFGVFLATLLRGCGHWKLLSLEERLLRFIEVAALLWFALALCSMAV